MWLLRELTISGLARYLGEFAYTAGQTRYAGTYADNLMDNPLQAFQLLKRLTINWNKIEQSMSKDSWSEVTQFVQDYRSLLPNQEDLNGAALALIRLQDTYNLTMSDMANGYIYRQNSMIQMSGKCLLTRQAHTYPTELFSKHETVSTSEKTPSTMAIMACRWSGLRKLLPELTKRATELLRWMR